MVLLLFLNRLNQKKLDILTLISFHLNNLPWAEKIRELLGFGTISFPKGKNYGLLTFYSKEGILAIINLIKGKMRTPK
jgi:hypothetical protein